MSPGSLEKIVTRFAPSPTGYLHIGGARTALFNWAYARRHGGTFILRMEDTHKARSTNHATHCIIQDLQWLGIQWDEGPDPLMPAQGTTIVDVHANQLGPNSPYFQSEREALYKKYLAKLIDACRAYPDKDAYRFKTQGRDLTMHDLVLGDVTIKADQLEDFVIMKGAAAGGGPTFHFANVVDDATMGVTHVLRAQEHLMNTPKHVALFEAFGIAPPKYAHMPLIFNADGSKMSKRDKAKVARQAAKAANLLASNIQSHILLNGLPPNIGQDFLDKKNDEIAVALAIADILHIPLPEIDVHDFRANGYLSEVVLNYIALLGWSPKGNIERFTLDYLVQAFDFDGIGKSNAKFDRVKLLAFNQETIAKLSPEEFFRRWREHLSQFHAEFLAKFDDVKLGAIAELYRRRARTLNEPVTQGQFFALADDKIEYDAEAVDKVLKKNDNAGAKALGEFKAVLGTLEPWSAQAIHAAIEEFAKQTNRGMGDVAQPLRVAVSGGTVSPQIHDTLAILGKTATLARIERCLKMLTP